MPIFDLGDAMEKEDHTWEKYDAQIEEYKSLRQEIMSRQNARRLILGFTITAIGSIIGFVLQGEIALEYDLDYYAFSLIIFAIVIIIAALILTIHHTQQIDVIGAYIRKFIKPKMPGLNWQTYWFRYRELRRSSPKTAGLPLGTSKPLSLYYAFLTLSTYSIMFIKGLHNHLVALILLSMIVLCSFACSYDLYKRKTRGWKINWDALENQEQ